MSGIVVQDFERTPLADIAALRGEVRAVTAKSREREAKEAVSRDKLARGDLGIDLYGMREKLKARGLRYVANADELKRK